MTPIFVAFMIVYHYLIVGTLINLDGCDGWDRYLIIPFTRGIMVTNLASSFLWTSWLVGIFQVYVQRCR